CSPHPSPTQLYPLPLPAALPIAVGVAGRAAPAAGAPEGRAEVGVDRQPAGLQREVHVAHRPVERLGVDDVLPLLQAADAEEARGDRKSTRLNSSHVKISYAVFCL